MGYCKNSVLDFHKTLLLLPVEYYYHTLCEVSDISVKEWPRKNRLNIVFNQKMYNGENGIQKYVCTLLAHFTEITLHTLLKYFKCNCLRRWCFHTLILFSFRSTFCHYAAFVNILRKNMYTLSFISPKRSL